MDGAAVDPCFAGFVYLGHSRGPGPLKGTLDIGTGGMAGSDLLNRLKHGLDVVCILGCSVGNDRDWKRSVAPGGVYIAPRGNLDVLDVLTLVNEFKKKVGGAGTSSVRKSSWADPRR